MRRVRGRDGGWTLLELLVVIGIVAVLAALLMPAIGRTRQHGRIVRCQSNLRDLGAALHAYAVANGGWMYPTGTNAKTGKPRTAHGSQLAPHLRWPAIVFSLPANNSPLPYDPAAYSMNPYDPETFPAEPFTPAVLRCPSDDEPREAHSYMVNGHLADRGFRLGDKDLGGRTPDEVILAGEKKSDQRDYFMQEKDFDRAVEPFRHGPLKGSNYLFLDGHAALQMPRAVKGGIDPWDVVK